MRPPQKYPPVAKSKKRSPNNRLFKEQKISGAPVVDKEKLVGIISKKDLKKIIPEKWHKTPVKAVMNRNPVSVSADVNPFFVVREMVEHNIGRLPVVHENKIIGIITRKDTLRYFYDMPEEGM